MAKTNLVSPLLWQSLPPKDETAWKDFLGQHEMWHRILSEETGASLVDFGDLKAGGLDTHQRLHDDLSDTIGIPRPGDLASYDLNSEDGLTNWMFTHSLVHQLLRLTLEL